MKKILIILIGLIFTISLYAQEVSKKDIIIQKTTPMLHINGLGGYINFYNGDVTLVQSSNALDVNGGRLDANGGLSIGEDATKATITEINILGGEFYMLDAAGDTIPVRILSSQMIDGDTVYPNITSAAADTTGITPGKIGDIYINTSGNKVYISKTAARGGWLILN
jgi:hypothetical protein